MSSFFAPPIITKKLLFTYLQMIQQHHSLPKRTVFVLTDVSEVNGRDPISYWAMSEYTFTKKPVLAQKKKKSQ